MRLDRFSPSFEDADRLGFVDVRPLPAYRYVYALPDEALARLACFFVFRYREPRGVGAYVAGLERQLGRWLQAFPGHDLFSVDRNGWLLVWDLRPASRAPLTTLRGVDRLLYQACDAAGDARRLAESVASAGGGPISADEVASRLEPLLERGLVVKDGSRYLALAIPLAEYSPPRRAVERFYGVVRAMGRRIPGGWVVSPDGARRGTLQEARALARPRRRGRRRGHRDVRLAPSQFSVGARGEVRIRRVES